MESRMYKTIRILWVIAIIAGGIPGELAAQPPDLPGGSDNTRGLWSLSLILLGILLFGAMRIYKRIHQSEHISPREFLRLQKERQQLLQYVATLDDQYARGEIQEQPYFSERKSLKQQLIDLTIQCKNRDRYSFSKINRKNSCAKPPF